MKYKVVRCSNCKTFQMSTSKETFKCVNCSKTKKINRMRIYFESDLPNAATQVLKEIKLHNKDDSLEFESAN